MKQHRKYLDDIVEESYSTNSFSKAMKGIRKYSLAALAVGALGLGSYLGSSALSQESEPETKAGYEQNQIEQEAQIEGRTKIAFVSNRDGNNEIYVMNPDGTEQRNLTNNPALDGLLSWSPDGKKIAFSSDRDGNDEIYVMNSDGTEQKRLTNNPADDGLPSWSPDGKKIAFMSFIDRNFEIYIMNPDGTEQRNLTNNSAYDGYPSWSPFLEEEEKK